MIKNNMNNQKELAEKFAEMLRSEVGDYNIALINHLNKKYDDNSCASHEILDANVVMSEAFESCFRCEMNLQNPEHIDLINDAWTIAKASDFFMSHICCIFVT